MAREGVNDAQSVSVTPSMPSAQTNHSIQPPPLGPRSPFGSTVLNPALTEDTFRRGSFRPSVPSLLKDTAVRTVSAELTAEAREQDIAVEDSAKALLDEMLNEFLTDVSFEAIRLAKRRKTNSVQGRDLGLVMNKRYGLNIPGGNCGSILPVQQNGTAGNEHLKRMAAIRKATTQANRQRYR